MKKTCISLMLMAAFASAQATDYDFPTLEDNTTYVNKYAPVATPSCIGANGIIYQTGRYDQMVMIGNDMLENIATSAFISAINPNEATPLWTVGIQGAARITAVTSTNDGIYVAGSFADGIILGSKDMNTSMIEGTKETHNMVNAFIAKYSLEGNLIACEGILPHSNKSFANTEAYENSINVQPTAIAVMSGKAYVSFIYEGGYDVQGISVEGNVFNAAGYVSDNACAAIISLSAADLKSATSVLDIRNTEDINTNQLGPRSIAIATDGNEIFATVFTSGDNAIVLNQAASIISFDHTEEEAVYGAIMLAFNETNARTQKIDSTPSTRYYHNNNVASMQVVDGKIYLTGAVADPLPFNTELVADLWTDQYAACLSATDFSTVWAAITGAKREDMKTTNEKYRESIGSAFDGEKYIAIGSYNFSCDATGTLSQYSTDYCLGISANETTTAIATKTDNGSKLSVTVKESEENAINGISTKASSGKTYDLSGRSVSSAKSGNIIIIDGKKQLVR